MSWIERILEELQKIPEGELSNPVMEVTPADSIVGSADLTLKRLYTFRLRLLQEGKRLEADLYGITDAKELEERMKVYTALIARTEAVEQLFWNSVRDDHGLWDKNDIGIRKDFVVVSTDTRGFVGLAIRDILRDVFSSGSPDDPSFGPLGKKGRPN